MTFNVIDTRGNISQSDVTPIAGVDASSTGIYRVPLNAFTGEVPLNSPAPELLYLQIVPLLTHVYITSINSTTDIAALGQASNSRTDTVFGAQSAESSVWTLSERAEGEAQTRVRNTNTANLEMHGGEPEATEIWERAVLETLEELEEEGVCLPKLAPFLD